MSEKKILVTGASGQIGTVLTQTLCDYFGVDRVIATDISSIKLFKVNFTHLDILDAGRLSQLVEEHDVGQIYHLAAILSAKGEQNPQLAWDVNMKGLLNVLEVARQKELKVFFPSSIAVFGAHVPRKNAPQYVPLLPETVYGISKVAGENWCQYYRQHFALDVRSLRYPGIISHETLPGGGTTDYAVEIFYKAVKGQEYECFLDKDTFLPMMYMEDAIRASIELMQAHKELITIDGSYNLAAISFSPAKIAEAISAFYPDFKINYKPDFRQAIAESWPESIDDSKAREDWNWQHKFDLRGLTEDMIKHLSRKYSLYRA